jgi:DNA-binding transcriptional LysR family regulator
VDYLKAMDHFVHVAKSASFSRAAAELRMSRASVTKQIKNLEDHIGVQLFNRTTRSVSLTEAGRQFYEFCVRIRRELSDEELSLASLQKNPSGVLRITAPRSFGSLHLGNVLAQFCIEYPQIHVTLRLSSSQFDFDATEFDLAITLAPPVRMTDIARKIGSLHWAVCASPSYLAKHGTPLSPNDLNSHNCLLHTANFPDRVWRIGDGKNQQAIRLKGSFAADSVIALRDAVILGVGIALLPIYCAEEALREGRLVRVLEKYALPVTPLYAVIPGRKFIPSKVSLLVRFLARWARTAVN